MLNDYFSYRVSKEFPNYFVIPNKNTPRIFASLESFKSFRTGLKLHNTASLKNKLLKKILLISYIFLHYLKKNTSSYTKNVEDLLTNVAEEIKRENLFITSFYIGTAANNNRKITAQICTEDIEPIGIVKIPLEKTSNQYISNEYEILHKLKEIKLDRISVPVYCSYINFGQNKILYQEEIFNNHKPVQLKLSAPVLNASLELANQTIKTSGKEYFDNLSLDIKGLKLNNEFYKLFEAAASNLKSHNIPTILIHGDFVKYNIKIKNDKIALIDWEFARYGLPLFDLFHFIFQGQIQINKKCVASAIKKIFSETNKRCYEKYLTDLHIVSNSVNSFFIIYLFDNLLFELRLKPNMQLKESNFFKALQIIQYE